MTRPENEPAQLRSVAETLAAEAAEFVRRRRAEVFGADADAADNAAVQSKTTPTDPVTVVDTETERLLRDRLAQLRPGDAILGEESGGPTDPTADPRRRGHLGAGPHRRHGEFRLRHPGLRGVGRGAGRRRVGGRRGRRRRRGRVYSAATGLGAHVTDEQGTTRCDAPPSTICRWRCWAPDSATPRGAARRRRRWWRGCCRWSAMCAGSVLRRWICAWSRRAGWMPTTSTGCRCGTARRVR